MACIIRSTVSSILRGGVMLGNLVTANNAHRIERLQFTQQFWSTTHTVPNAYTFDYIIFDWITFKSHAMHGKFGLLSLGKASSYSTVLPSCFFSPCVQCFCASIPQTVSPTLLVLRHMDMGSLTWVHMIDWLCDGLIARMHARSHTHTHITHTTQHNTHTHALRRVGQGWFSKGKDLEREQEKDWDY